MKLILLKSPRLNYPHLARFAGVSILTAVSCLVNLPMAVALPSKSLQKALLSLYSTYGSASLPVQSGDTPDPVRSKPTQSLGSKIAPLKGIYMEQVTSYGVGGMVTFDFDTYAVFQDGTISRDLNEVFGDQTARNPKSWGRWQQSGNGFNVTWNNGKTKKLGGSLFYRTFAASSGDRLEGLYRSLGGGGNTALGGDVMIIDSRKIQFYRNGSFEQSSARGGSSSQTATSSSSSSTGTYTLNGHTIELRYADGRTVRTSFYFFPSKGVKTSDSIGIGNRVYSRSRRKS